MYRISGRILVLLLLIGCGNYVRATEVTDRYVCDAASGVWCTASSLPRYTVHSHSVSVTKEI